MTSELNAPSVRLSPKKERAAQLLAKGMRQAEAARDPDVHVTKQTMNTWVKDPELQRRINELRTNSTVQAEEILAEHYTDAARVLVEIMLGRTTTIRRENEETGEPEIIEVSLDSKLVSSRLKAALFILERTAKKPSSPSRASGNQLPRDDSEDEEMDGLLNRVRKKTK